MVEWLWLPTLCFYKEPAAAIELVMDDKSGPNCQQPVHLCGQAFIPQFPLLIIADWADGSVRSSLNALLKAAASMCDHWCGTSRAAHLEPNRACSVGHYDPKVARSCSNSTLKLSSPCRTATAAALIYMINQTVCSAMKWNSNVPRTLIIELQGHQTRIAIVQLYAFAWCNLHPCLSRFDLCCFGYKML